MVHFLIVTNTCGTEHKACVLSCIFEKVQHNSGLVEYVVKICSAVARVKMLVSLIAEVKLIERFLSTPVKYLEFTATVSTATSNSIYLTV